MLNHQNTFLDGGPLYRKDSSANERHGRLLRRKIGDGERQKP